MMYKILACAILVIFSTGCQQQEEPRSTPAAEASATTKVERSTLTCFGDSLTEGLGVDPEQAYPSQLERRLQEAGLEWEVVNAGLAGETSSGARTRLGWVLKTEPDAVLLLTGGNDELRGIDPALTKQNIDYIVGDLKSRGIKVMLGGMKSPPNLGSEYTDRFEAIYPWVAEKHDVPLIPFFLEGVARDPELNQADGKHPTAEGYTKIVDHIFEPVKEWLES